MSDVVRDAPRAPVRRLRLSGRSLVALFAAMVLVFLARSVLVVSIDVLVLASGAALVASLLHPIVLFLQRRLPRPLALIATVLSVAGVVGGLAVFVVGEINDETARLKRILPEAAARLEESSRFRRAAREFGLAERVREVLDALPARLTGGSGAAAVQANANRGITLLAGAVLTIFLLLYGPRMLVAVPRIVRDPARRARAVEVAALAYGRSVRYLWSRVGVAFASGATAFLLCHAFDVPGTVVLGVVVGLGSTVPGVGIVVAGLPIALLAGGLHGTGVAALVSLGLLQVTETVLVQRRLGRRILVVGPAPTLLVAIVCFELGGLAIAILGAAAVAVAASVLAELAPDGPGPSGDVGAPAAVPSD